MRRQRQSFRGAGAELINKLHSPAVSARLPQRVYSHVFRLLNEYDVMLEGILLKPNMILPGGCTGWPVD